MKKYRFANAVYADTPQGAKKFSAGDVVGEGEVLAGCLASMLYTGYVVELDEEKKQAPPAAAKK
jgi:hypothetical protein